MLYTNTKTSYITYINVYADSPNTSGTPMKVCILTILVADFTIIYSVTMQIVFWTLFNKYLKTHTHNTYIHTQYIHTHNTYTYNTHTHNTNTHTIHTHTQYTHIQYTHTQYIHTQYIHTHTIHIEYITHTHTDAHT